MTLQWGMLAGENVKPARRRLTLGLGKAVRLYNEAAVPGLGGLWFIRQAALALLGLRLAEKMPDAGTKIEVTNAIEALACWLDYRDRDWARGDWRLRGPLKLKSLDDRGHQPTFARLKAASSYVSQPMRMGVVQALPSFGLVDTSGTRFNGFSVNEQGNRIIETVFGGAGRSLPGHLQEWLLGETEQFTPSLRVKLSPTSDAGPAARALMREAIVHPRERTARRRAALAWVEQIDAPAALGQGPHTTWMDRPSPIDADHWADLHAGAVFLETRDAAVGVLAEVEQSLVGYQRFDLTAPPSDALRHALDAWRSLAKQFSGLDGHGPSEAAALVRDFCREAELPDGEAIAALVRRENHMTRVTGNAVVTTSAWRTNAALLPSSPRDGDDGTLSESVGEDAEEGTPTRAERDLFPPWISTRLVFMRRLALDTHGQLDALIEAQGAS